jgi:hypothetical protein
LSLKSGFALKMSAVTMQSVAAVNIHYEHAPYKYHDQPVYFPPMSFYSNAKAERHLQKLRNRLSKAQKKYQKYVAIACTTPAYVWIPVFGTIPAVTVAAIYGKFAHEKQIEITGK